MTEQDLKADEVLWSVPIETENSLVFGFKPTQVAWVVENVNRRRTLALTHF